MKEIDTRDFAALYAKTQNTEEAAIGAGISPIRAKLDGLRLLMKGTVRRQIKKAKAAVFGEEAEVRAGLERLAFGRANDAAALAFCEEITPEMIANADLYNVSEIKRVKGGGVEIKLFDRQKALEALAELSERSQQEKKARNLVEAIYGKAESEPAGEESDDD